MLKFESNSAAETERFAAEWAGQMSELAKKSPDGNVTVCLSGDMGTGKTVFATGFAAGLGIKGDILSPTFTLVREYKGIVPLYHFDWYRLSSEDELYEIGWEDYLMRKGICLIEWAEMFPECVPDNAFHVIIKKDYAGGNFDFRRIAVYTAEEYEAI